MHFLQALWRHMVIPDEVARPLGPQFAGRQINTCCIPQHSQSALLPSQGDSSKYYFPPVIGLVHGYAHLTCWLLLNFQKCALNRYKMPFINNNKQMQGLAWGPDSFKLASRLMLSRFRRWINFWNLQFFA